MNSSVVTATAGCLVLFPLPIACFNYMQRYACAHPCAHTVCLAGEQSQADISQADMSSQLGG